MRNHQHLFFLFKLYRILKKQNQEIQDIVELVKSSNVDKGVYFLIKEENPKLVILATGSEVQKLLKDVKASVIFMTLLKNKRYNSIQNLIQSIELTVVS